MEPTVLKEEDAYKNEFTNTPVIFKIESGVKEDANKELKSTFFLVCNNRNTGKYFIRNSEGGNIPDELSGGYTNPTVAVDSCVNYVNKSNFLDENKRTYHKNKTPKN